jgi:hypothetical protein
MFEGGCSIKPNVEIFSEMLVSEAAARAKVSEPEIFDVFNSPAFQHYIKAYANFRRQMRLLIDASNIPTHPAWTDKEIFEMVRERLGVTEHPWEESD